MDDLMTRMDRMFHPNVVAVVGDKQVSNYRWLKSHAPFQGEAYAGKVYHVNVDRSEWSGAEALGFQNVANLQDIPEPVDYVTLSVPNTVVPIVLRDCVAKGVGAVHIFAAGFAETHAEQGIRLEETITAIAREGNLLVVGPNSMGLYLPKIGIRPNQEQPYGEDGFFSYISQSGTTTMSIGLAAPACGIPVSKGISFGNGTILDCTDFLEYLGQDDDTEMIGMYLEGIRDGRRFFETLREAARRKPVIVWKVGQSEEGARAGLAHTGSAPIPSALWDAMLRQCGAIQVGSTEEMLDTAVVLRYLKNAGPRVALIAVSGGHSGKIADVFGQHGFLIPSPSQESRREIGSYASLVGGSFANPFEGNSVRAGEPLGKTLDVLGGDSNFDMLVMEVAAGTIQRDSSFAEERAKLLSAYSERWGKPVLVVVTSDVPYIEGVDTKPAERQFLQQGIACIPGMERGAKALRNALDYYEGRP